MSWELFLERGIYAGAGALASLGVAYVAIVRELYFIKGSMSSWTKAIDKIASLDERQGRLEATLEKHGDELEALKPVPCDLAN